MWNYTSIVGYSESSAGSSSRASKLKRAGCEDLLDLDPLKRRHQNRELDSELPRSSNKRQCQNNVEASISYAVRDAHDQMICQDHSDSIKPLEHKHVTTASADEELNTLAKKLRDQQRAYEAALRKRNSTKVMVVVEHRNGKIGIEVPKAHLAVVGHLQRPARAP
jgi:hypothetical protein